MFFIKIKSLYIDNVNRFEEFYIRFNEGINIISGINGIGKTTLLNCIKSSFKGNSGELFLNTNVREYHKNGFWKIETTDNISSEYEIDSEQKKEYNYGHSMNNFSNNSLQKLRGIKINNKHIINFSIDDRTKNINGKENLFKIKKWLCKNYYLDDISYNKYENIKLIKEFFYQLDHDISFLELEITNQKLVRDLLSNESQFHSPVRRRIVSENVNILVKTPQGIIPYEYLSSGYISCLSLLMDIVRQIENKHKNIYIQDYQGVILIDEIELHLHPEWQQKLLVIIKWLLPNAQIIATTHSPHVIQSVNVDEIIILETDLRGNVVRKSLPINADYGYQGWMIEEILEEVMGMKSTKSERLEHLLHSFKQSLKKDDMDTLGNIYSQLSDMIHPNNPLLKILSIQAGSKDIWEVILNDQIDKTSKAPRID